MSSHALPTSIWLVRLLQRRAGPVPPLPGSPSSNAPNPLSPGAVAGIVVGALAGIGAATIAYILLRQGAGLASSSYTSLAKSDGRGANMLGAAYLASQGPTDAEASATLRSAAGYAAPRA